LARFEIILSRRPAPGGRPPAPYRSALGRFGALLGAVVAAIVAVGAAAVALVLGYLFAGLVLALVFLAILLAMGRSAFRAFRR
jgi:hypothetical protein